MNTKYICMAGALLSLMGCATPQLAIEQANQGVALVAQMELELKEFRRIETASEQVHKNILAQQKAAIVRGTQNLSVDNQARQAAGAAQVNRMIDSMATMIQRYADDEAQVSVVLASYDKTLAGLLAPLPSTTATTATTQTALANMGKELPFKTRAAEFKGFVDQVKKSVNANKQKIADAEAAAATP